MCISSQAWSRLLRLSPPAGWLLKPDGCTRKSREYRADILRSMQRSVLDREGLKVLPMFPETHALLKRVDYSARDYYALVAPLLLEVEFLDPEEKEAGWLRTFLRERGGLLLGMSVFQEGVDHAYTYGYWMDCLRRNEIKRVLLGFYASLAYGMSRDTYAAVEVTRLRVGRNENDPAGPLLQHATDPPAA